MPLRIILPILRGDSYNLSMTRALYRKLFHPFERMGGGEGSQLFNWMKRDFVLNRLLRSARLICSRLNFGRYLPRVGSPEHPQRDLILETAYPIPCRRSALSELLIFGRGVDGGQGNCHLSRFMSVLFLKQLAVNIKSTAIT
ncbi:hypothetical protein TNIN_270751 [Trichonephila inaurata madagascariensis]|uniref:Uncharacterized protein n=1 Tax=Trichonephila inaurata madagascariensis TaxID=2747483 RepID=A0A8X6XFE2_9ARAC|nr:hypothetical protein TNIN_270751 [Trichonephila inaurata madagascariensis]